jgi:hypothetical protein
MANPDLTKAEKHFLSPERVVAYGIRPDCALCPEINQDLRQSDISEAMLGVPRPGSRYEREYAASHRTEKERLVAKSLGCSGCEKLGDDEIAAWTDEHRVEAELDDGAQVAGYRCPASGETYIAISYGDGHVGLRNAGYADSDYLSEETLAVLEQAQTQQIQTWYRPQEGPTQPDWFIG